MKRIAVFIVNYNMPERTNALWEELSFDRYPHDVYVIDNGSDLVKPSPHTNIFIDKNIQTTNGWLYGVETVADRNYFAYMFMITSAELPVGQINFLDPLAQILIDDPNAVIVHPALTKDSTTSWKHMITRMPRGKRQTWMVDNIASLVRANWFKKNKFDPDLIYGWGIDLEMCWKARTQGRTIWISESSCIKKETNIGYKMNRMNMSARDREFRASENANQVFTEKYGLDWRKKLLFEARDQDVMG